MNKKAKKYLAGFLCVILLLSMAVIPASAGGIIGNEQISTSIMNELSVRAAINSYFSQRLSFLNGETTTIDVINEGMMADETAHKAYLEAEGIVMQSSSVAITEVSCWDNMATALATETAVFVIDGETVTETIIHEITLCCIEKNVVLQSDAYCENESEFASCSYISPEKLADALVQINAGGSSLCIAQIAYNEEGTKESADGSSIYGLWYETYKNVDNARWGDWCAMFVSWCAYYANVSSYIVPCDWNVGNYRTFFLDDSAYYTNFRTYSSNRYIPSVGDVIFINGTAGSPQHVGLVYTVSSNIVWIVDGNWRYTDDEISKVHYRSLNIDSSQIVAFGKPDYATMSHSVSSAWQSNATHHWHLCANCGGGVFNRAAHTAGSTWYSDGLGHWKKCTVCGLALSKINHTSEWDQITQLYKCPTCGFDGPPLN